MRRLKSYEKVGIALLLLIAIAFGGLVEFRSAFLQHRRTDVGCFFRGAWAVRTGHDLYAVVDDNDWHYNYPPIYAILLMPLADPPKGFETAGFLAYPISVAIICVLNFLMLGAAVHFWAAAFEETSDDPSVRTQPRFCRRWWALRLLPTLVCIGPVAQTIMRGQVNIMIMGALCLASVLRVRKKFFWSGMTLSFAIAVKVIPVYLLAVPMWRREGRTLAGCLLGLSLGLIAIPAVVMGPNEMVASYCEYGKVFFGPLLDLSNDQSRTVEILGVNSTDSIGVKNVVHNWLYPDPQRRPPAPLGVKAAYVAIGGLLTLAALLAGRRRRIGGGAEHPWLAFQQDAIFILLMAILSPICHLAYMMAALPLMMALLARRFHGRDDIWPGKLLFLLSAIMMASNIVPSLPGCSQLKDLCVPMLGSLPLLGLGLLTLGQPLQAVQASAEHTPLARAA